MQKILKEKLAYLSLITSLFVLADQFTKFLTTQYWVVHFDIIDGFFRLMYSENTGIAFSIPMNMAIMISLNILLMILVIFLYIKELNHKSNLALLAVSLILGGGLGNMLDRLFNGYVIDFISIWKYPIFNLADVWVTAGVLSVVFFYDKIKKNQKSVKIKNNGKFSK